MAEQIQPVSNNNIDPTQVSSFNNDQITNLLVGGSLDPKFASMLLGQMATNNVNSILFGNESNSDVSSNAGVDMGLQSLTPNNIPNNASTNINDIFGTSAFSSVTPQFTMSVYSSLIGKTVTAVDPLSGKVIADKVKSVYLQEGKTVLDINGTIVPVENISKIQ